MWCRIWRLNLPSTRETNPVDVALGGKTIAWFWQNLVLCGKSLIRLGRLRLEKAIFSPNYRLFVEIPSIGHFCGHPKAKGKKYTLRKINPEITSSPYTNNPSPGKKPAIIPKKTADLKKNETDFEVFFSILFSILKFFFPCFWNHRSGLCWYPNAPISTKSSSVVSNMTLELA